MWSVLDKHVCMVDCTNIYVKWYVEGTHLCMVDCLEQTLMYSGLYRTKIYVDWSVWEKHICTVASMMPVIRPPT